MTYSFPRASRRATLALTATLALAGAMALQPAAAQQLVPAQSDIGFVSKQMGVPVEGHFTKFSAQVVLDPAKPEAGKVSLTVDTGSATLGVKETDAELPKPVWFNV
ncbi:YceI family protein, partial [Pulveribacter sp.]